MPKRSTHTYSSEDAQPEAASASELVVYYCKYGGENAFILDTTLARLPRRRTDAAYIVDREQHMIKFNLVEGGSKLVKRGPSGDGGAAVERQYRMLSKSGALPVCYRCEESLSSRFVYILPKAVTAYDARTHSKVGRPNPVPKPLSFCE